MSTRYPKDRMCALEQVIGFHANVFQAQEADCLEEIRQKSNFLVLSDRDFASKHKTLVKDILDTSHGWP